MFSEVRFVNISGEFTFLSDGDDSGFFRNDDDCGIGAIGESDGCAVSASELHTLEATCFGEGELYPCGDEAVASDYYGHIVKWCAVPEDCSEQFACYDGVEFYTCFDEFTECDFFFDNNYGPGFECGEFEYGVDDLLDAFC